MNSRALERAGLVGRHAVLIVTLALLVGCAAPEASPSPTLGAGPTATAELSPAASPSPTALATPTLSYVGPRNYRIDDDRFTAYELALTNLADYPAQLFVDPAQSPCLLIGDAASNAQLAEFCPLESLVQLTELSFSLPRGQAPPAAVYVELLDRRTGATVRSGSVAIEVVAGVSPTPTRPTVTPGADGWIGPERISTRNYGDLSLVIDGNGIAHAAAVLGDGIFYLTNASGSWTRERLTRSGSTRRHYMSEDRQPRIGIDRDGSLWIIYVHEEGWLDCLFCTSSETRHLAYRSGRWSEPTTLAYGDDDFIAGRASVAVRDGRFHVALDSPYLSDVLDCDDADDLGDELKLRYRTNASGSWMGDDIAAQGSRPSIVLSTDGRAHVVFSGRGPFDFCDPNASGARYAAATSSAGSFAVETIPGTVALDPVAIALDTANRPHIVLAPYDWEDGANAETRHVTRRDGAWSGPELVVSGATPKAIAVDARGVVHIAAAGDAGVFYASNRSGRFETKLLLRSAFLMYSNQEVGLALDADGRAHVLFLGEEAGGTSELWYAVGPVQ